jgi:hypothetical protein
MKVQISQGQPAEEVNGLGAQHDALMTPEAEPIVAVVIFARTKRVFGDSDSDDADYPVVRMTAIEPLTDEDARAAALASLESARVGRTGQEALDLGDDDDNAGVIV